MSKHMDPAPSTSKQSKKEAPSRAGHFSWFRTNKQLGHKLAIESGLWTVTLYQLREALKQPLAIDGVSG